MLTTSIVLALVNCEKKKEPAIEPAQPTPYNVRMTDAPGPYTAVNVDIQGVEITTNGNAAMLSVTPGIYNLLNFTNGVDTLIATGNIIAEKVQQIRLILGPNNSVVVGGNTYPLSTPSADQSGLKLQVHHVLQAGVVYNVLLDFDAAQSIVVEGNGTYKLKPVIRTVENAISGAIKGSITPSGVPATITAVSGSSVFSTVVNANGDFIVKGLPAGIYTLSVTPVNPFNNVNVNSITVTTGLTTSLSPISI